MRQQTEILHEWTCSLSISIDRVSVLVKSQMLMSIFSAAGSDHGSDVDSNNDSSNDDDNINGELHHSSSHFSTE